MFGRSEDRTREKEPQLDPAPATAAATRPVADSPAPQRTPSRASGEVSAYFGRGSKISGKLNFEGAVHIDGKVDGEIHAKDTLVIGDSAEVTAEIHASSVVLRGVVRGDIKATKRLEIRAPGRLFGNVETPALVIEEGVVFEGSCVMENLGARSEAKVERLERKEPVQAVAPVAKAVEGRG